MSQLLRPYSDNILLNREKNMGQSGKEAGNSVLEPGTTF